MQQPYVAEGYWEPHYTVDELLEFLDTAEELCWLLELEAFQLAPVVDVEPAMAYSEAAFSESGFSEGEGGEEASLKTLLYSDRGYISHPTDTPASTWYEGRIKAGMRVERRIIGRDGVGGLARVFVEIALVNRDGGLDMLTHDYALPGRAARLYVGRPGDPRAHFGLVASAVTERIWTALGDVRVRLSDGLARLDRNVNTTTYAGTGGLEGGADLKGKYKPKAYGPNFNVSPPLVDSAKLIYQVHDGAINDVPAVYDRQILLTQGADYASQSDLETIAPSAGEYRVWKPGGFFRLGATPDGTLTSDVEGDATGSYISKTGEIVQRILEAQAGFLAADINTGSFASINASAPAAVGIWIGTEGRKIDEAADELLAGIGAFGGFSRLGQFTVGLVAVPQAGTSAATFTEEDIVEIERLPSPASVDPIVWRTLVGYQRNYTVQSDLAAGVTAERRTFAAEPIRVETADDASIQSRHRLARELLVEGLYRDQADAAAETDRLLDLWGVERSMLRVKVPPRALLQDLGDVVTLQHSRYGLSAGVDARVLGHALNGPKVELTVLV